MDRNILGLKMLKDLENMVNRVKHNLKEPHERNKIYADKFRRDK